MVYNWRRWTQPEEVVRILEAAVGRKGRLWIAVTYRDATAVRGLLERGDDPLYRDEVTDQTVFRQAVLRGDVEIVRALADAGALKEELEEDGGGGALFAAVVRGHKPVVALLLEGGVDAQIRDESGRTALIKAIDCDKSSLAVWLVRRSGDLDATDRDGDSALHHACRRGKLGVVRALVRAGADHRLKNRDGDAPAALASDPRIVDLVASGS